MVVSIFRTSQDYNNLLEAVVCSDEHACRDFVRREPIAVLKQMSAKDMSGNNLNLSPLQYTFWALDGALCEALLQYVPVDLVPQQIASMPVNSCVDIYRYIHLLSTDKESSAGNESHGQIWSQIPVHMVRHLVGAQMGYGYINSCEFLKQMSLSPVKPKASCQLNTLKAYARHSQSRIARIHNMLARKSSTWQGLVVDAAMSRTN